MKHVQHLLLSEAGKLRNAKLMQAVALRDTTLIELIENETVLTYISEGEKMPTNHLQGKHYYHMTFDLDVDAIYVHMKEHDGDIESVASLDGNAVVDYYWNSDGLPVVVGFELLDARKTSIIRDWIEDGIESALTQLNQHSRHDFADDHWKGVLINEQEE